MKRIFCVLTSLLLIALCACGLPEPETTMATTELQTTAEAPSTTERIITEIEVEAMLSESAKNYTELVERIRNFINDAKEWYHFYADCVLYDMDDDGVPELFIKFGTCEADYTWYVYAQENGKASLIGKTGGTRYSALHGCGAGGVYKSYGRQGNYGVNKIIKQDGKLLETTVVEYHYAEDSGNYDDPSDMVDIPTINIEDFHI